MIFLSPSLQTECTRNEFRFTCWKAVCSEIQDTHTGTITKGELVQLMENDVEGANKGIEEQTAWRPDPLKFKLQDLNISEGPSTPLDVGEEGLLDISQEDPAVLVCGNVVAGEEVFHTTLTLLNF